MTAVSRRGLFGLFAGAVVAPMIPRLPVSAAPSVIIKELTFAYPGPFVRYSGYEVLNITPSDIVAATEYDWRWPSAH
jgi:hypothetical protein